MAAASLTARATAARSSSSPSASARSSSAGTVLSTKNSVLRTRPCSGRRVAHQTPADAWLRWRWQRASPR
eukprot:5909812-Prymnesium_polylepis.1